MNRILFVLDELFPVRGAPQVRIHNFISALEKSDIRAVGGRFAQGSAPENFTLINRPSERKPLGFILFLLRLGLAAGKVARSFKPDVLVLSVPKYEMLIFAPALSRLAGKLVLDFRDSLAFLDYGAYLSHFLPGFIAVPCGKVLSRLNSFIRERALKSAALVTVANEGIKEGIHHPQIRVIPNGVDTELFEPAAKLPYIGSQALKLVYLGNFAEKDRFEWLCGLSGAKNIEIHLIGEGRNREKIASLLKELNVTFHGSVPHEKLPPLLAQMDLGFIIREKGVDQSVPVCLFEFSAMNIPSVCNDTGIMAQFVRNNGIGLVVQNEKDFCLTVQKLLEQPEEFKKFETLHATAGRFFSLEASRRKFAQAVASLTGVTQ